MKKVSTILTSLLALFSLSLPMFAPAAAQAQTTSLFCYTFATNLGEGHAMSAANANALQQALVAQGLWNVNTPITSYTDAVASAVTGFQEKYAAQILTPNELSYGTGYVGASTREELNSLYGCSVASSAISATSLGSQTFACPSGWTCTPPPTSTQTYACPTGWTCIPLTTVTTSSSSNSASANFHLDVSSPSGESSQTSAVPIMVFNILAPNETVYLNSLTANISTSGIGNVTNAYLYANGTQIATASVLDGTAQFNSISSIAVEPGTEQLYTLAVDTVNADDLIVTAVVYPASIGVSTATGPVSVLGGAYGNPITVVGTGTSVSAYSNSASTDATNDDNSNGPTNAVSVTSGGFGSPTWSPNPQPTGIGPGNPSLNLIGDTAITWPITFTVNSGSSPIYISATPNSAVFLGEIVSGATPVRTIDSITAGASVSGDTNTGLGTGSTGSFMVPANSNRTFTVTATLDNSGNTNPATEGGLQFNEVYYSSNPTPAGTVANVSSESAYNYGLGSQSPLVTLSGEVPITSTASRSCDTSTTFCVSPAQSRTFNFNLSAGGGGPVTLQTVQALAPGSQDVLITSPSGAVSGDTSTTFLIPPSTTRAFDFTITAGVNPVTISNSQVLDVQ